MDVGFLQVANVARAAITVKDSAGYCVYANRRAEELRRADAGSLIAKHITELAAADPVLVEREFQRVVREGAWAGQYAIRCADGSETTIWSCAYALQDVDEGVLLVSLYYPIDEHTRKRRDGPPDLGSSKLSARDLCLGQLYVDGHSDEEVACLLGISHSEVDERKRQLMNHAGASSMTEACIQLLKAGLVV